ncbi:50S ribosomal protein L23 [Rothia amarae]|uniref:50S ribosomal protein L23 n=1 Tax=Rothia amarae TaxID=169480 RepID=UPI000929A735|nr:50S ribosomal protein L23 [Mycobacteroides abscessus subsp. abscessus]
MSVSINKNPRDVIIAPVVSEKSYGQFDEGKYTFLVDPSSNKLEIKQAIEEIFDVKVASVNTANRQGKRKRTRFGWGTRKSTKRAIVTLSEGTIDLFGGPQA